MSGFRTPPWMPKSSEVIPPFEPEITTPLPLPGEHIVLQLNPVAMAKHLDDPKLIRNLRRIKTDKYLAIVGGYYEEISVIKPWHMVHVYLYYDEEDPMDMDTARRYSEADTQEESSVGGTDIERRVVQYSSRPVLKMLNLVVRIRTRLCALPRRKPNQIPEDIYRQLETVVREKQKGNEGATILCRSVVMARAPSTKLQSGVRESRLPGDALTWEAPTALYELCLLPHADYSFDLNQPTALAFQLECEHANIISMLCAANRRIPQIAFIPTARSRLDDEDYFIETRAEYDTRRMLRHINLSREPVRANRTRRRLEMSTTSGWFSRFFRQAHGLRPTPEVETLMRIAAPTERPISGIIVHAPPIENEAELHSEAGQTLWGLLAELWEDVMALFVEFLGLQSAYPAPRDDVPYIPFERWHQLVAEGVVKRWEPGHQEPFPAIRRNSDYLSDDGW